MKYNESVNLGYSGSYVGASVYVPVQKVTQAGFYLSARRVIVNKAELTMSFDRSGNDIKRKAHVLSAPQELTLGCFLSIFYINYVKRFETWAIEAQGQERFSVYKGHADGFELGLSGPIWSVWP
jgi:hypothetical protein